MHLENYKILSLRGFLRIVVVCLLVVRSYGETSFQLVNYGPEVGLDARIFDASGVPLSGETYVAELYGGKSATSLTHAFDFDVNEPVRVPFLTGQGAGYFNSSRSVLI